MAEILVRVKELVLFLKELVACHPEAESAEIWAGKKAKIHVKYVGYDRRHKPARVKLEEE
jgi:hypothetical protein